MFLYYSIFYIAEIWMKNKLLSGAFWMMLGSILSRILGIVYLIPWLIMMGNPQHQNAAQAIFNTAYTPYALFLSLGTAGFPTAPACRLTLRRQRFASWCRRW